MFPLIKEVKEALDRLCNLGYEAYLVGGAIRDYYYNFNINDYDIATNANVDEIIECFKDYKYTLYANKRTVLVKIGNYHIELTPYKGENILSDLSLRDFSIDSIALSKDGIIYDPLSGYKDLENRILSPSYDTISMIKDDPLRILRGIRFIYTYNLSCSLELKEIFNSYSYLLNDVNTNRFKDELDKILVLEKPSSIIREFKEVFFILFPHLKNCYKFDQRNRKWHHLDVFEHILLVMDSVKPVLEIRYAALFHDIDKPLTFTQDEDGVGHFYGHFKLSMDTAIRDLTKYHYSKKFISLVAKLVYYHDRRFSFENESLDLFIEDFGSDIEELKMIFELMRGDIKGQNPNLLYRIEDMNRFEEVALKIAKIRRER